MTPNHSHNSSNNAMPGSVPLHKELEPFNDRARIFRP